MTPEPLDLAEMETFAESGHIGPCEDVFALIAAVRERDAVIARVREVLNDRAKHGHHIDSYGVDALRAALDGES